MCTWEKFRHSHPHDICHVCTLNANSTHCVIAAMPCPATDQCVDISLAKVLMTAEMKFSQHIISSMISHIPPVPPAQRNARAAYRRPPAGTRAACRAACRRPPARATPTEGAAPTSCADCQYAGCRPSTAAWRSAYDRPPGVLARTVSSPPPGIALGAPPTTCHMFGRSWPVLRSLLALGSDASSFSARR